MNKYRMRVTTKVYFTVDVIAKDEESAKEMIMENIKIEEYTDNWSPEFNGYVDDSVFERMDNIEIEAPDDFWEEDISLDDVIEEDIEIPDDDEDDDEY